MGWRTEATAQENRDDPSAEALEDDMRRLAAGLEGGSEAREGQPQSSVVVMLLVLTMRLSRLSIASHSSEPTGSSMLRCTRMVSAILGACVRRSWALSCRYMRRCR